MFGTHLESLSSLSWPELAAFPENPYSDDPTCHLESTHRRPPAPCSPSSIFAPVGSHQPEECFLCFRLPLPATSPLAKGGCWEDCVPEPSIKIRVGFEENDQGALCFHDFIAFGKSVEEKVLYICRHNLLTHFPRISNEKI